MVWLNQSELESTEIKAIKPNAKGTGWILEGFEADGFCWNSNPQLQHLLVALASWIDTKQGKAIEIVKDSKQKAGFRIQPKLVKNKPVEAEWIHLGNGYALAIDGDGLELNPFL